MNLTMNHNAHNTAYGERLIDAKAAAYLMNLPMRWLTQPKQRHKRGVPYYRVGKLVRFRLSELSRWMEESQGGADA
jgi:hypothetical protein